MNDRDTNQERWPSVSVVVVTRGHHDLAERAVSRLLETDYPSARRQIIVVEETDEPQPICGAGVKYQTIPVKNRGVSFARNTGLDLCDHQVLAFTDDDCLVEKDWLKEIVRPMIENPEVAATAGAVLVPPCGPVGQCENILGFPGGGAKYIHRAHGQLIPMATFSTCNCAINRDLTGAVRFQEGFQSAGEDELLSRSISATFKLLYNPNAIVLHQPRDSFIGVFKWFIRRGQARVEMARHTAGKKKYTVGLISTSPLVRLTLFMATTICLRLPLIPMLFLLGVLYYASVLWRFRWSRAFYRSLAVFLLIPVVKTIMDIGMDVGIVKTLASRRTL